MGREMTRRSINQDEAMAYPQAVAFREKANAKRLSRFMLRDSGASNLQIREILAEGMFKRMLCWERKRAERSGEYFLLMLIDAASVLQSKQANRVRAGIMQAVSSSTRETDIAGW